jgi:hypothetical protein
MPKVLRISLSTIAKEIDKSTKTLMAAKANAATPQAKRELDIKIKDLKKTKKELQLICHGLTIIVPQK